MSADQFEWYRAALAGEATTVTTTPQAGFYEWRRKKAGARHAVALWRGADGLWRVRLDGKSFDRDPDEMWTYLYHRPIPKALYDAIARGEPWPDAAPGLGHNSGENPDDPASWLNALQEEESLAAAFLRKPITTQEAADKAANWSDRVAKLGKRFAAEYERLNRPLLQEQTRIRELLLEPSKRATDLCKSLTRAQSSFLADQRRKAEEAARRAREEAEEAERDRLAQVAQEQGLTAALKESLQASINLPPPAAAKVTAGGATGRKTTLRDVPYGKVTDYVAFASQLILGSDGVIGECANPDLKACLDKIAQKMAPNYATAPEELRAGVHGVEFGLRAEARR
jgi:hypothetical protein